MRYSTLIGLGATLLACAPAQATTFNLGTLANGVAYPVSDTLTATNPFDIYNFTLASAAGLGGAIQNVPLSVLGVTYNFSSLTAQIFAQGTTTNPIGTLHAGDSKDFSITDGNYYVKVTGVRTGNAGGAFALGLLAGKMAAPAPGPSGWLVMTAGLGALVFLRRRGKASTGQAVAA